MEERPVTAQDRIFGYVQLYYNVMGIPATREAIVGVMLAAHKLRVEDTDALLEAMLASGKLIQIPPWSCFKGGYRPTV